MKRLSLSYFLAFATVAAIQSAQAGIPEGAGYASTASFESRFFARNATAAAQSPAKNSTVAISTPFLYDAYTKRTNELIVSLKPGSATVRAIVRGQLPNLGSSDSELEEGVVSAINAGGGLVSGQFAAPRHARRLLGGLRLDSARRTAAQQSDRALAQLDSFMVLRYPSVQAAEAALAALALRPDVASVGRNEILDKVILSWTPTDPYFAATGSVGMPAATSKAQYQWGLEAMGFASAWNVARGSGYVGVYEPMWPGTLQSAAGGYVVHPDLSANFRRQLSPGNAYPDSQIPSLWVTVRDHAMHVTGIIGATPNNGGISGGCPNCSIGAYTYWNNTLFNPVSPGQTVPFTVAGMSAAFAAAVNAGVSTINWSGAYPSSPAFTCPDTAAAPMCAALDLMRTRSVLLVEASGNFPTQQFDSPLNMANAYPILPVGGVEPVSMVPGTVGTRVWSFDAGNGSHSPGILGVMGPARSIVSTISPNSNYNWLPHVLCGDISGVDESGGRSATGYGDGLGSCTGTSMAAPFLSSLAALVKSINPLATAESVRTIIQQSGSVQPATAQQGFGLPNANTAVTLALTSNPTRLTPMFSFYSPGRTDSFYTTSPQMASVALAGTLLPMAPTGTDRSYGTQYGTTITGYQAFPGGVAAAPLTATPRAEFWLFTTHVNPKSSTAELQPLYRMSWVCSDATPYPPSLCGYMPAHGDTTYVLEAEIAYHEWLGYRVDGIEGYVYPKTMAQPAGTDYLIRLYNPARDDHAIFPYSKLDAMYNAGYTMTTNGINFLGWVYPNVNGSRPAIQ